MKFLKKITNSERIVLLLLALFTLINWWFLSFAEKIAPPDFYKIYFVAERLFSGDIKTGIIPPLFPALMYPFGKFVSLFVNSLDAFIIAGRIIALSASIGVLYLTYLFLKKITGQFAILGIVLFVISPWFLKLIAFPVTDMLYLLFVTMLFYSFLYKSKGILPVSSVILGVLTRFEGVLLIAASLVNYFKLKKRNLLYMLGALIPIIGIIFFFRKFVPRFFAFFKDILLPQKTYLYIFLHPIDFLNIIYGNILFFIPYSYPDLLKWILLIVILLLFGYGVYRLFKIDKKITLALLAYEVLFFMAKGHININRPDIEFRRVFSGLWIFYLLAFIGCYFLIKRVYRAKTLRNIFLIVFGLLMVGFALSLEFIQWPILLFALLMILPVEFSLRALLKGGVKKIIIICVLLVFSFQIYNASFFKSKEYVVSMANKGAFAAAQWLNMARMSEEATILSYVDNIMLDYYVTKKEPASSTLRIIHFTVPHRYRPENKQVFINFFLQELQEKKVDYILFDHYVVQQPEFLGKNDVHRMLFEEKENPNYFRIKKHLIYKGKPVGYVLKPIYDKTNH
jgi:hypothetical protein